MSGTVHQIDFLPASYREVRTLHADRIWQFTATGAFLAGLAVASFYHVSTRQSAERALDALEVKHDEAVALRARLSGLQKDLAALTDEANLRAYLRHRWPLTRVLDAVFQPLPDSIALKEFKFGRHDPAGRARLDQSSARTPRLAAAANEPKKRAAQSDLAQLREICDRVPLMVQVSGSTTHTGDLYRYVAALSKNDLVAQAEITSIETAGGGAHGDPTRLAQFQARVLLRPGYGQPKGPKPLPPRANYTLAERAQSAGVSP